MDSWDGKGGLNMSRALGDELAREAGVTERPEIKILKLEEDDDFLLLCSDGVWEFVSRDAACSVVRAEGRNRPGVAVHRLSEVAYAAWMEDSGGDVADDITCIVFWL